MYIKYFKRIFDILISLIGFLFFLPLLGVLGLLIKFEDRGPIFYKAERIGKDNTLYEMYKFRSMKVNVPILLNSDGSTYNGKDDSRVTKIGKFIRETSIDEIPQIINVLKGDMSIIGPRASLASVIDTFKDDEKDKMKVRPGITGYTQAYYRNGLSNREKRVTDAWYANNVSFWLDVKIFFKTIPTVLKREGIYTDSNSRDTEKDEGLVFMKKVLFISNISNKITNFSLPSIYAAKNIGYEFHMAANYSNFEDNAEKYDVKLHHIDLDRNPFSKQNITAYKQMLDLIEKERFDVIHCNTPIGGVLGRLCGKKAGVSKVIYTAHGFHFYKGASLINRTIFKWAEMWMARYTDSLITMNEEDYQVAQKFKLKNNGKVYYVPGVGVDTEMYQLKDVNPNQLRKSLGLSLDDIVLIAMGDLIDRKNYESSIKAIAKVDNPKIHFLICGNGPKLESLAKLAIDLRVENQIHFLGFRTDIKELLTTADIFLFTTYQEGLPRSMMEAMSAGLPCIASKVRGNVDLIQEGIGGFLREPDDSEGFAETINTLASDKVLREKMKVSNLDSIKKFDVENVIKEIEKIYREVLTERGRKNA
jgi:lipopolysaccharide/colanic/teichoic acid biosynthesis glycosyltransferase